MNGTGPTTTEPGKLIESGKIPTNARQKETYQRMIERVKAYHSKLNVAEYKSESKVDLYVCYICFNIFMQQEVLRSHYIQVSQITEHITVSARSQCINSLASELRFISRARYIIMLQFAQQSNRRKPPHKITNQSCKMLTVMQKSIEVKLLRKLWIAQMIRSKLSMSIQTMLRNRLRIQPNRIGRRPSH